MIGDRRNERISIFVHFVFIEVSISAASHLRFSEDKWKEWTQMYCVLHQHSLYFLMFIKHSLVNTLLIWYISFSRYNFYGYFLIKCPFEGIWCCSRFSWQMLLDNIQDILGLENRTWTAVGNYWKGKIKLWKVQS